MMRFASSLVALAAFVFASACDPVVNCTLEARSSVTANVDDDAGAPVTQATVRFAVDGGEPQDCDDRDDGSYVCGFEIRGDFVITAEKSGHDPSEATATIGETDDGCHVESQLVRLILIRQFG